MCLYHWEIDSKYVDGIANNVDHVNSFLKISQNIARMKENKGNNSYCCIFYWMSHDTTKCVFGVSDQATHKPAWAATEVS